jgi:hypothetical protein
MTDFVFVSSRELKGLVKLLHAQEVEGDGYCLYLGWESICFPYTTLYQSLSPQASVIGVAPLSLVLVCTAGRDTQTDCQEENHHP